MQNKMLRLRREAIQGSVATILMFPPVNQTWDLETLMAFFEKKIIQFLVKEKSKLSPHFGLRFILKFRVLLGKYNDDLQRQVTIDPWFSSSALIVYVESEIPRLVKAALAQILANYDNYVHAGSGWSLRRFIAMEYTVAHFEIVRGGCCEKNLPYDLLASRGVIMLKNCPKNLCFFYSVAACILKTFRNPGRGQNKSYLKLVNLICYKDTPMSLSDVKVFERKFPSISVNVYGYEKGLFPLYVSGKRRKFHASLILHEKHFFPIRNLSAIVKRDNNFISGRKLYICDFCLSYFSCKNRYSLHLELCHQKSPCLHFPSEKSCILSFFNYSHMVPAPFAIYCDLESIILPLQQVNDKKLLTVRQHKPISAGALTVCHVNPLLSSEPFIYTGEDCIERLFSFLQSEVRRIDHILMTTLVPLKVTPEVKEIFRRATVCSMCGESFTEENYKVKDHDHLTGAFRAVLCNSCNFTHAKTKKQINVFFHGLSNYDSHFLIQEIYKMKSDNIFVIPKSSEKYLSFKVDDVIFKDTYQFLGASLATLVKNLLSKGTSFFENVQRFIPDAKKQKLMFQKGIFPYSYIDSLEKLQELSLPPRKAFQSDLTGEHVSEKDYSFAQAVWKDFGCQNLQEYMEIYLLADVLLLADVFENFRKKSYQEYSLDPCHYFSTPHFTLDAFLIHSQVSLELIMDINQYLFLIEGIRGGLSMVCKRFSKSNNPSSVSYNPSHSEKHIYYFDANNLYGKAMTWPLPHSNFRWMPNEFLSVEHILSLPKEGEIGCIIECDFEYPAELHDFHEDYPLAPTKTKICYSKLSCYAKDICDKYSLKSSCGTPKLMATLLPKKHYVLHFWNFQLYVQLGLKVSKIHRGIMFTQKSFVESYIMYNSEKRAKAKNDFDSNLYKLLCNSLFGKFMQNPVKKSKVVLTSDSDKFQKNVGSSCFKECKIINDHLVAILMGYPAMKIDKPFYIGLSILELSKYHMYNFHYNTMKKLFPSQLKLLYTDTDSFLYEITSSNCEESFFQNKHLFDFSNYPKNHKLYSIENKKVPGLFKDECGGNQISEFIGLRSKMYSFVFEDENLKGTKTAKGVKKNVIEHDIKHQDYRDCLFLSNQFEHQFANISSSKHKVVTAQKRKISLSPFDDKRYLLNNIFSLPYGHYRLE